MQQVGVVAEEVIDQPAGGGVAGQRAQQVLRGILPPAPSAMPGERQRERPLVIGSGHDIGPPAQQGVVQRLVEQPVCDDRAVTAASPLVSTRKLAADDRANRVRSSALTCVPSMASMASCHSSAGRPGASAKASAVSARSPAVRRPG